MLENNTDRTVISFYNTHFSQENIRNFCKDIARNIIETYFLSNTIDNANYEQNIFKIIKKLIIIHLNHSFKNNAEFNTLLSVHIFKKHFKLIFEYLGEYLIREVAYSNDNVINFLKYYSLNTIVVDTKKYEVPQIKETDGPRWNVVSMLSVVKTYVKTLDQLKELQNNLKDTQAKIQTYYIESLSPVSHNEIVAKKFEELEISIAHNASQIQIINDSLIILTSKEEIIRAKKELESAHQERMDLRKEKSELIKSKIKQIKMLEYQTLLNKADSIQRKINPKNKIIEQNHDAYTSIQNALIKALISKRQAL